MKKYFLFSILFIGLLSCSTDPKFKLKGEIDDFGVDMDGKEVVVARKVDGTRVNDTIIIKKNAFSASIPFNAPEVIHLSIPYLQRFNRPFVVDTQEDVIRVKVTENAVELSGNELTDRLNAFLAENDAVSVTIKNLTDAFAENIKESPEKAEELSAEYADERMKIIRENTDRLLSFLETNINNVLGESYFKANYFMMDEEDKAKMKAFASPKLKEEMSL